MLNSLLRASTPQEATALDCAWSCLNLLVVGCYALSAVAQQMLVQADVHDVLNPMKTSA